MAYVCCNPDGNEIIWQYKPIRDYSFLKEGTWQYGFEDGVEPNSVWLPKGTIKKILGFEISWEDDCVDIGDDE